MPILRFKQLGLFYLIALGGIALSIIISQILIQNAISSQQDDARIINVAGRQRMLSQKISKVILQLRDSSDNHTEQLIELKNALDLWTGSHNALQFGDSEMGFAELPSLTIQNMFQSISKDYEAMKTSAQWLIENQEQSDSIDFFISKILDHENAFLVGMNKIVFQYDEEARKKVKNLKSQELYLFVLSLLIIILELIFIFVPLAKRINTTMKEMADAEMKTNKMNKEISKLYDDLGKNYQDLEAVNIEPESLSLFANIRRNGEITFFSEKFMKVMEYEEQSPSTDFRTFLYASSYTKEFVDKLSEILESGKNWTGELKLINEPGDFCWLEAHLIPTLMGDHTKLIARDITALKEAKIRSREINKERIEKSIKDQQYRSAFILEGQEEERRRLSRELHDGVGQMLSAMKLLLESFTASSAPMKKRLADGKSLMKSIIQEVRRVSFNLTPTSLEDFGLVAALKKFCFEMDTVAKPNIIFENKSGFINRLNIGVERNLYRIVQEAVNNAIKYAKADSISVELNHTVNTLFINITDNGKGFNIEELESMRHFEKAGHGIFNMRERASYIGSQLCIDTASERGTKISLTLTLNNND